jgi:indole-3-glycerol phosphate synthase
MSGAELGVLKRILDHKRQEVAALKRSGDLAALRRQAEQAPPPRDFLAALKGASGNALIAEIKRASPSAGQLAAGVDPARQARLYQSGGAACLSVLTDREFFSGSLEDLRQARAAVELPVLRKDFIINPVQVDEARAAGADAVLLIAAALEGGLLAELYQQARGLGLTVLLEVHAAEELEPVLALEPRLVGINNRNLKTMQVNLQTSLALRRLIPDGVMVVAESGISGPAEVSRLKAGGLDAFLVGSHLMLAPDAGAALRELVEAV